MKLTRSYFPFCTKPNISVVYFYHGKKKRKIYLPLNIILLNNLWKEIGSQYTLWLSVDFGRNMPGFGL